MRKTLFQTPFQLLPLLVKISLIFPPLGFTLRKGQALLRLVCCLVLKEQIMSLLICPPPIQTRPIPVVQMLGFFHINYIVEYFRTSNLQGPVLYFTSVSILEQKQAATLQFSVSRILSHRVVLWQTGRISCHLNSFQSSKNKLMEHTTPCWIDFIRLRAIHILEVQPEVWSLPFHISNLTLRAPADIQCCNEHCGAPRGNGWVQQYPPSAPGWNKSICTLHPIFHQTQCGCSFLLKRTLMEGWKREQSPAVHCTRTGSWAWLHPSLSYFQTRKRPAFTGEAVTWVFLLFEGFVFSFLSVCLMTGNYKTLSVHVGNKSRLTKAAVLPKLQETLNKRGLTRHMKQF